MAPRIQNMVFDPHSFDITREVVFLLDLYTYYICMYMMENVYKALATYVINYLFVLINTYLNF